MPAGTSEQHPEAAGNPLLFHLRVGAQRGWLTERPVAIEHCLPSNAARRSMAPESVAVDVIIPVYRGLAVTRRCVESVLADTERPAGRIIVIDDRSPEPKLSAWLDRLASSRRHHFVAQQEAIWGSSPRSISACGTPAITMSRC